MALPLVAIYQEKILLQISTPHDMRMVYRHCTLGYTLPLQVTWYRLRRQVLQMVKQNLAFPNDSIRVIKVNLWRKLFMQDRAVSAHCKGKIKGLINNVFVC